jgi:hypothetical protein
MTESPSSPEQVAEHRSWRRWAIGSVLVLLLLVTPIVSLHLYDAALVADASGRIEELDLTEPGWRTLPAQREPLPADADSVVVLRRAIAMTPGQIRLDLEGFERSAPPCLLSKKEKESLESWLAPHLAALAEVQTLKAFPEGRFDPDLDMKPIVQWWMLSRVLDNAALDRLQRGEVVAAWDMCQAQAHFAKPYRDGTLSMGESRGEIDARCVLDLERVLALGEVADERLAAMQKSLADEARFDFVFPFLLSQCDQSLCLHDDMLANRVDVAQKMADFGPWFAAAENVGWWDRLNERYPRFMLLKSKVEILRRVAATLPLRSQRGFARYEAVDRLETEFRVRAPRDHTFRFVWSAAFACHAEQRTLAFLGCAQVGLAAERQRLKFGRWPATLTELVDRKLLSAVPEDPYDGKPLRLRNAADGIVIHSVGEKKAYDGTWYDDLTHRSSGYGDDRPPEFRLWNPECRRQPAPP